MLRAEVIAAGSVVLPLAIAAPLQFEPIAQQVESQKPDLARSGKLGNLLERCESWRRGESLCFYLGVSTPVLK